MGRRKINRVLEEMIRVWEENKSGKKDNNKKKVRDKKWKKKSWGYKRKTLVEMERAWKLNSGDERTW